MVSSFIPDDERIVTIEDAAELRLMQPHVVSLESRPPNAEGRGEVAIRDLVRNALRMRPDRIVVGEARGGEALDMLQAMNTGHEGSLTTVHANSPRDALSRLETMVLMAGLDLPVRAIREQVASGINLIVHLSRMQDGTRRVTEVAEVQGMEGDVIILQTLFDYDYQAGQDQVDGPPAAPAGQADRARGGYPAPVRPDQHSLRQRGRLLAAVRSGGRHECRRICGAILFLGLAITAWAWALAGRPKKVDIPDDIGYGNPGSPRFGAVARIAEDVLSGRKLSRSLSLELPRAGIPYTPAEFVAAAAVGDGDLRRS